MSPRPEAIAGGPIRWLHQGRTPTGRGPLGIVRLGPPEVIAAEVAGKTRAQAVLSAGVPRTLHHEPGILLEEDLGREDPTAPPPAFPRGIATTLSGTLGDVLQQLDPPGGVNVTPLVRALRKLPGPLPFRPGAARIQRALRHSVEITVHRGWGHGALTPARLLAGGACHWQRCDPERIQEADLAAIGPLTDPAIAACAVKWGWRFDAGRAAEALVALGAIPAAGARVNLSVEAHPGISAQDLTTLLGCAPGAVTERDAARALGRAKGLVVGGVAVQATASPPVAPHIDPAFRQPRRRDPRRLLDRYHLGAKLDEDARASLTPQRAAETIARKLPGSHIVDGFCGAGGNAIAFARAGKRVTAIDTRADRLEQARHNAGLYGVADRITFRHGDFFALTPPADACFLDPPWAGGDALLAEAWETGRRRYRRGMVKLPRTFAVPDGERLAVYFAPGGFPAFVTVGWGL